MDSSEQAAAASRDTLDAEPAAPTEDLTVPQLPPVPQMRPTSRAAERFPGVGDVVGAYTLLALIGEGSIGRIYLAEHTKLSRRVALKMLRPELSNNPKFVKRFFAEARAVNAIAHENIVQITDFVESDDHPSFIIMELLEGSTLSALMNASGPLSPELVRSIGMQLSSALQAAHRVGIVHRDVKPDNVFLLPKISGYQVKLLDFGIAKVADPSNSIDGRTNVGDLVGTPFYMSPEQARGWPASERSDIYAFGVLLYEMTTGQRPFYGETVDEVLELQISAPVVPPRERAARPQDIPEELEALILACLEKDPMARIGSMAEIGDRLDALGLKTARLAGPLSRRSSRLIAPLVALSATSLTLAIAAVSYLVSGSKESKVAKIEVRGTPATSAVGGGEGAPAVAEGGPAVAEPTPAPAPAEPTPAEPPPRAVVEPGVAAAASPEVPGPAPQPSARAASTESERIKKPANAKRAARPKNTPAPISLEDDKPILDTETRNPFGD